MKFTSITCPNCGYEQAVNVPEKGVKALHKCDHCKIILRSDNPEMACVICAYGNEDCPGRAMGHASHQGIRWNKITWYSKIIAVILFVVVYMVGFWLGTEYQITANEVLSLQEESRVIAHNVSKQKTTRVLGVATESRQATYWIDVNKQNPFIDECVGDVAPNYINENYSLAELISLQLAEERNIDRLTGLTNPLAKTNLELKEVREDESGVVQVFLFGNINNLTFCEQIQAISQLRAVIKQEQADKQVDVVLNEAILFSLPAKE